MTEIEINTISGNTPVDVYVGDYLGNNIIFIGSVTGATNLPIDSSLFNTMSSVMLIMSGSDGCETFKIIDC